jgi:endonuclease III
MAPSLGRSKRTRLEARRRTFPGSVTLVSVDRQISVRIARTLSKRVIDWYAEHARDLPWRRPVATPWAIMISEFMLQQTPVERVRGPWQAWLERWPTPPALAAATPGDAVRAWGRLGYPRRALRLHQAAQMITNEFGGDVPEDREALLRLPGVGSYTARQSAASRTVGARSFWTPTFGVCWPESVLALPCRAERRPPRSELWPRS